MVYFLLPHNWVACHPPYTTSVLFTTIKKESPVIYYPLIIPYQKKMRVKKIG